MIIKDSAPTPLWKTALRRGIKWVSGVILILVVISFVILSGAATTLLNAYLDQIETAISHDLGRDFKVERVKAQAFPWLVFELESMEVDDLLKVESLEVELDTLQALISFGQKIEINEATVSGIHINLVRDSQGVWNLESSSPTHSQKTPSVSIEDEPMLKEQSDDQASGEELLALLKSLHIGEVHLRDVRVTLDDKLDTRTTGPVTLIALDLDFPVMEPTRQVIATLNGQVMGAEGNFTSELNVGPYDKWLQTLKGSKDEPKEDLETAHSSFSPPFPLQFKVNASAIDLSLLSSLSPEIASLIGEATSGGHIEVSLKPAKAISVKGEWSLKGLRTGQGTIGQSVDINIAPQLQVDLQSDRIKLSLGETKLGVNQMEVQLSGDIYQSADQLMLDGLKARSSGINVTRIFALAPHIASNLPQGAKIEGPINFSVNTTGAEADQSLELLLDLNKTNLNLPDLFVKTSKDPLNVRAKLRVSPKRLNIRALTLTLGEARLSTQGLVSLNGQGPSLNTETQLSEVSLAQLAKFIPSVRQSINKMEQKIEGRIGLESTLALQMDKTAPRIDFEARLSIGGAHLDTDEIKIMGSGGVIMRYTQIPGGDFSALFDSNLSSLDIKLGEAFVKPRGVKFDIELEATKVGHRFDIPQLSILLADLRLKGIGRHDASGFHLTAKLPPTKLTKTLGMFGAAKSLGPDIKRGRLGFTLNVNGGADPASDLTVDLNNLALKSPHNKIRADLHLSSPSSPLITFNLKASQFDFDKLFPARESSGEESSGRASSITQTEDSKTIQRGDRSSAETPPFSFKGEVKIKRGQARGVTFRDLSLDLRATDQALTLRECTVKTMKGKLNFHPLIINLKPNANESTWSAELDVDRIDLARAQQALKKDSRVEGRLSGGFKLKGKGLDWEHTSRTIDGQGHFNLKRGVIKDLGLKQKLIQATVGELQKTYQDRQST